MIDEYNLEDDSASQFRGGSLRINPGGSKADLLPKSKENQSLDKENAKITSNCNWGQTLMSPFASIPNKLTVNIWGAKPEPKIERTASQNTSLNQQKTIQSTVIIPEDPCSYFTFREGVVDNAVKECREEFLDEDSDGPLLAYFLLTQINHWDTDKERLILLTPKTLVIAKYDFIALKRLGYKKLPLDLVEQLHIGDLVYPNGSLIPRLNGVTDGLTNFLENCLFSRWGNSESKPMNNFYQSRDRNMRGARLMWKQEKPATLGSKWNPFTDNVPFCTFTYHPLYFHKDGTVEPRRNIFDLDTFVDKLCDVFVAMQVKKSDEKDYCAIYHKNIVLENYVGIGSLLHNRNALGFFKVRGKFSF
ncbi:tumor protein p63-regulated gene 1-like protein isoform X1 [Harmonia axyridis]|uniref:tumor protein p63-regulated gene 1-like protein isoform X1 n=1 Tax=Harmonia axyridis TaxID=115357 RepID=UPI001E2754A8|nr:tumor protein p63-regulated gene 1-like protein isoform X1 [Harmonia axyridis]